MEIVLAARNLESTYAGSEFLNLPLWQ